MSVLHLRDPDCEIARYILVSHWKRVGHQVVWCDTGADGDRFELPLEDLYPLAGRVVSGDVCAQRIAFMVSVGWLPEGEFQLGADSGSVQIYSGGDLASKKSPPWLVPDGVLPLDKIALALGASSVETGLDEIDRLAIEATEIDWETFEIYSLQVILDWSRRVPADHIDIDSHPLGATRTLEARTNTACERIELAEQAAASRASSDQPRRKWWSRK